MEEVVTVNGDDGSKEEEVVVVEDRIVDDIFNSGRYGIRIIIISIIITIIYDRFVLFDPSTLYRYKRFVAVEIGKDLRLMSTFSLSSNFIILQLVSIG